MNSDKKGKSRHGGLASGFELLKCQVAEQLGKSS